MADDGAVTSGQRGEAFIQARFGEFNVGAQVIVIPKGLAYQWPNVEARNYIDEAVYGRLKKLRLVQLPVPPPAALACNRSGSRYRCINPEVQNQLWAVKPGLTYAGTPPAAAALLMAFALISAAWSTKACCAALVTPAVSA